LNDKELRAFGAPAVRGLARRARQTMRTLAPPCRPSMRALRRFLAPELRLSPPDCFPPSPFSISCHLPVRHDRAAPARQSGPLYPSFGALGGHSRALLFGGSLRPKRESPDAQPAPLLSRSRYQRHVVVSMACQVCLRCPPQGSSKESGPKPPMSPRDLSLGPETAGFFLLRKNPRRTLTARQRYARQFRPPPMVLRIWSFVSAYRTRVYYNPNCHFAVGRGAGRAASIRPPPLGLSATGLSGLIKADCQFPIVYQRLE